MAKREDNAFVRGSLLLTASAVAAKLCGALFKIPLTALLGGTGMGYFSTAYGLFLPLYAVLVTGLSTAVAQPVARCIGRGDPAAAKAIRRTARRVFLVTGLLGTAGAILGAGAFTRLSAGTMEAYPAVLLITPAVLFCSLAAVERGYYEGLCRMAPTAVSQAAEAVVKLVSGLWLTMAFLTHPPAFLRECSPAAAGACGAVLGVTLSALAGWLCAALWYAPHGESTAPAGGIPSARSILRELFAVLVPASLGALITNLTTLIDLVTVMRLLPAGEEPAFVYGSYMGMAVTVFGLVPSLTNMLAKSALPCTATAWARGERSRAAAYAKQVLVVTGLFAIPAGCGLGVLARGCLEFLFAGRGAEIAAASGSLRDLAPGCICLCLVYPVFSLLQAVGRADLPPKLMLPGIAVKFAGNLLLLPRLSAEGAALSTSICYAVILLPALLVLRREMGISLRIGRPLAAQCFGGILCGAAAWITYGQLRVLPQRIAFLCAVAAGAGIYGLTLLLLYGKALPSVLSAEGNESCKSHPFSGESCHIS